MSEAIEIKKNPRDQERQHSVCCNSECRGACLKPTLEAKTHLQGLLISSLSYLVTLNSSK